MDAGIDRVLRQLHLDQSDFDHRAGGMDAMNKHDKELLIDEIWKAVSLVVSTIIITLPFWPG